MRGLLVAVVTLCLFAGAALAEAQYKGLKTMNGYSLTQFGNFIKDWKLVTVRFRHDTQEMRFTYANDIAWKTLAAGRTDYPDGAIFAKVGIMTGEDPAFPSSAVPGDARRYQLMVKDSVKHKETDGWGYAIFGSDGLTLDENPVSKTAACHACHTIVQERGYVFSVPMQLAMPADINAALNSTEILGSGLKYETVDVTSLPDRVRGLIPPEYKQVRLLQGSLRTHLFSGTLDEIRPALILEVLSSKLPALLLAEDNTMFSFVYSDTNAPTCLAKGGAQGLGIKGFYSAGGGMGNNTPVQYCFDNNHP